MGVLEALVGILGALVGAQIFVTKWMLRRSDRHLERMIDGLTRAVEAFREFEKQEDQVHTAIVATQERILDSAKACAEAQREILTLLERIHAKIDVLNSSS